MSHDPQSPTDAADFDPIEPPFCAYIGGTCNGRHACCDDPEDEGEDDGCCPGCGACPGFTGVECDETCEWATTGGGAA
jgi:hypothetical protein